jgi:hypothetical protein
MENQIEILVGDVTDMEAHVYAHYTGTKTVNLRGLLRGPFCERARTLPADFEFRDRGPQKPNEAEAIITDPCMWTAEMPQLYQVDVHAFDGDRIVSEYHGTIGLQRIAPRRPVDFAPGTG